MINQNIREKIIFYLNANPNLSHEKVGILLNIDSLYSELPADMEKFRSRYIHLDPTIIDTFQGEIRFLKIQQKNISLTSTIKRELNNYLNIKYNSFGKKKSYSENMIKFKRHSQIASLILTDVLKRAKFSSEVQKVLNELTEVASCHGFYEMLVLFKKNKSARLRFEILRKLGLILLIARIERCFFVDDLNFILQEIEHIIKK